MKKHFIIVRALTLYMVLFFLLSCSAKAQDAFPADMVKSFADAGLPLLKEKVTPRDFSLPLVQLSSAPAGPQGTTEKNQSLAALKGKVVFLNFWATWCGPCRAEMPSMEALYGRYRDKGLEILAVNLREEQGQVITFMKNNSLTFPSVLDRDGRVGSSYGIQAIPTSFIIDREGKIILRVVGSLDWDSPKIHAALELLLE